MKTLKQFIKWLSKTGQESKKNEEPLQANAKEYASNIYKELLKREKEREEFEQLGKKINHISSTIVHLPRSVSTKMSNIDTISSKTISASTITVGGVDAPLIVNGRNIVKELDDMRDALLLLKREVDMEEKYPRLKELKDQYEAELAKYKTFEALK